MSVNKLLQKVNFSASVDEIKEINKAGKEVFQILKESIKKEKINADLFFGGSFAKGTMVKKEKSDVDIYIRFPLEYESLQNYLEKIINRAFTGKKYKIEKIHGSRDYFRVHWNNKLYFEIIPVSKIKHPREARNVTDLSYFHVNYVKKNIRNKSAEITLAKSFCKANGIYGAESYIRGFSGYGLECLIIFYKSFENMLKNLAKIKDRIIIDPAKNYKKKEDVLFSINESKLKSPIILVDPTWKERNVLAALSYESFKKFQESGRAFLKNPSINYFKSREKKDKEELIKIAEKNKAQIIEINIETDKQEGDIAGTKLKKFSSFLRNELESKFKIIEMQFHYDEMHSAVVNFILFSKGKIVKIGPPADMKEHVLDFKKINKNSFVKNGRVHAYLENEGDALEYIKVFSKNRKKTLKEMHITDINFKKIA